MNKEERQFLRSLAKASTEVNQWSYHGADSTVRGPFCRWFKCTEVDPKYKKHVAESIDDCKFAAAAMNSMVPLLDLIDALEKDCGAWKELALDRFEDELNE